MILDANGNAYEAPKTHPLSTPATVQPRMVEIVRSVSFKLNLGNYQSMDFFCSQKAQCAPDMADEVSVDLYDWCYDQVMDSVREVQKKQAAKIAAQRSSAA